MNNKLGWAGGSWELSFPRHEMETSSPSHCALRICESAHTSEKGTRVVLGKGELHASPQKRAGRDGTHIHRGVWEQSEIVRLNETKCSFRGQ